MKISRDYHIGGVLNTHLDGAIMMSAVNSIPVNMFDNGEDEALISMARAFLMSDGETKLLMARAMLAMMDV